MKFRFTPQKFFPTSDRTRESDAKLYDLLVLQRPMKPASGRPCERVSAAAQLEASKAARRAAALPQYRKHHSANETANEPMLSVVTP